MPQVGKRVFLLGRARLQKVPSNASERIDKVNEETMEVDDETEVVSRKKVAKLDG